MSPQSKAEVSLCPQKRLREIVHGMGDDERARVEPCGSFGAG